MPERADHYYNINIDGEWVEGHILASEDEAKQIELLMLEQLREWGYDMEEVDCTVELGGEYDFVLSEDITPDVVAKDILYNSGFTDQGAEEW